MTQGELAFAAVRDRIMNGTLGPGLRLSEQAIADELKLSRTPVREALRRLAETGLIELTPNQRATVVGWNPTALQQNFDTRILLEAEGARCAAEQVTGSELLQLAELMEAMEEIVDSGRPDEGGRMAELNETFHALVVAASRREHLMRVTANLRFQPRFVSGEGGLAASFRRHANHQHRDIYCALEARDSQWAEAAMRAHLLAVRHASLRQMSPDEPQGRRS